jgi:hypothetical protein
MNLTVPGELADTDARSLPTTDFLMLIRREHRWYCQATLEVNPWVGFGIAVLRASCSGSAMQVGIEPCEKA